MAAELSLVSEKSSPGGEEITSVGAPAHRVWPPYSLLGAGPSNNYLCGGVICKHGAESEVGHSTKPHRPNMRLSLNKGFRDPRV